MLLLNAGRDKILVIIANRQDPDQTASEQKQFDLGLRCLSRPFWQAISVPNLEHLQ